MNNFLGQRNTLLANIDTMLEFISQSKMQATNSSFDLFGDVEEVGDVNIAWKKPQTLLTMFELLQMEKESLGVYMNGNPLVFMEEELLLARRITGLGSELHLGIIEKVRKMLTKKQEIMYIFQMTLASGNVEGVIFPKQAPKYAEIIAEKKLYWIAGKLEMPGEKDESPNKGEGIDEAIEEGAAIPKITIDHIALHDEDIDFQKFVADMPPKRKIWPKKEKKVEDEKRDEVVELAAAASQITILIPANLSPEIYHQLTSLLTVSKTKLADLETNREYYKLATFFEINGVKISTSNFTYIAVSDFKSIQPYVQILE
jgi:DNA polymerase III alpha subunit